MMLEYEYLFSIELQRKLREKIVGNIFVKVVPDNKLVVSIRLEYENINFVWTKEDFSTSIIHGYCTEYACYEILSSYKRFITHKFFKESSN